MPKIDIHDATPQAAAALAKYTAHYEEGAQLEERDEFKQILELGGILETLVAEKEAMEAAVESLAKKIERIQGDLLPKLMDNMNPPLKEFKLASGMRVSRMTIYKGKLTEANKPEAFAWLEQTGNAALIKNNIDIQFGREQNDLASEIVDRALELGAAVKHDQTVHHKTLDSFIKEQITSGNTDFPREIFNVNQIERVTITK